MDFHKNIYNELNDAYVTIRKLKGKYCLDKDDLFFLTIINDTSFIFNDLDGPDLSNFKEPFIENHKYIFNLGYNYGSFKRIEIKIIDKELGIQVWHYLRDATKWGKPYNNYYLLKIPIENIIYIPILYTRCSLGKEFSNFSYDDVDFIELFKN